VSTPASEARHFFLAVTPDAGAPRLVPEDDEHARRVLRIAAGERVLGLDGEGGRYPMVVERAGRDGIVLASAGAVEREPEPGAAGSELPWIELALSLPRGARAEEMLDRVVQLGVAAIQPLLAERTQGFAREVSDTRRARLLRVAREACKQSRRAWLPVIHEPLSVGELASARPAAAACLLSPAASARSIDWACSAPHGTRARPLRVFVGPEGGFSPDEERAVLDAGAVAICLGPHVLRIETAAEAAVAGIVQAVFRRADPHQAKRSRSDT
jgi:16S rRNA (uracil1498-N3)-methyltransferase